MTARTLQPSWVGSGPLAITVAVVVLEIWRVRVRSRKLVE
jgi:hypothetical protein